MLWEKNRNGEWCMLHWTPWGSGGIKMWLINKWHSRGEDENAQEGLSAVETMRDPISELCENSHGAEMVLRRRIQCGEISAQWTNRTGEICSSLGDVSSLKKPVWRLARKQQYPVLWEMLPLCYRLQNKLNYLARTVIHNRNKNINQREKEGGDVHRSFHWQLTHPAKEPWIFSSYSPCPSGVRSSMADLQHPLPLLNYKLYWLSR